MLETRAIESMEVVHSLRVHAARTVSILVASISEVSRGVSSANRLSTNTISHLQEESVVHSFCLASVLGTSSSSRVVPATHSQMTSTSCRINAILRSSPSENEHTCVKDGDIS